MGNPFSLVEFTAKIFNTLCDKTHVQQSMRHAGCTYDNAPMERFYHTLNNEFFRLYRFDSTEKLDQVIYKFIYVIYNHVRPHFYNVVIHEKFYTLVLQFCLTMTKL